MSINQKKTFIFFICLFLLFVSLAVITGCEGASSRKNTSAQRYTDFRTIPGVTNEDIKEINALIEKRESFIYGLTPSTEAFYNNDGELDGFAALFCEWLTELFGIPFELKLYEWDDLLLGLENGSIDFTNELTATDERRKTFFMTDGLAERLVGYFRISGCLPFQIISAVRQLRFGFLSGTVTHEEVSARFANEFEVFFVDSYEEAYINLKNGSIDAYIEELIAEPAFEIYGDVEAHNFFPLIYGTVSLTTQKKENEPVINIIQKAIENNAFNYFVELYNLGMQEYNKHKLLSRLTEEELVFLQQNNNVMFAAEHDNYPISFYNIYDREFQGISHDVLKEIEILTGLKFNLANDRRSDWSELLEMLETGKASIVTELIRTPERAGRFLWTDSSFLIDNHALLSKTEHRNIKLNEILYIKIALVEGTAQTEIFNQWFPAHRDTIFYDNYDKAFAALERGEVDMVMGSYYKLLTQTNFKEQPGYKANIIFDYPYESTFGFNINEAVLRSIIDKTLYFIDTKGIAEQWARRTYDYRVKLQQQQNLWLISAFILLLGAVLLFNLFRAKKRLERESKFKTQFLAAMSHEIRTPLNAIIGISQIAMQENGLSDRQITAYEKIHSSGNNLLGIINDILDMSKIETGKLELNPLEYDVANFINDTVQLNILRIGSKLIEFKLNIDENLPSRLYGDELRLKQILNNLLSNAIKYTEKGQVVLSVHHEMHERNDVYSRHSIYDKHSLDSEDLVLKFIVQDTGQGIKSDDKKLLFSEYLRFNTEANRKTEGTGIGLNITRNIVEMMGGAIYVESEYGKGSAFTVTVWQKKIECPVISAETIKSLCNFTYTNSRVKDRRKLTRDIMPYGNVLVVDDVETNLYVAQGMLAPYKLNMETASSGFEAIEKIKSGKTYDVIFMDHMMPQMDGIETTKKIREWEAGQCNNSNSHKRIPIIALTANALVGNDEMFAKNDFDGFIPKPIDVRQLNSVLIKFIRDKYPDEAKKYKPEAVIEANAEKEEINKKILKAFCEDAEKAIKVLQSSPPSAPPPDLKLLTVTVHAMKSALANIEEHEASKSAAALEKACLKGDIDYLKTNTENFINTLYRLIEKYKSNYLDYFNNVYAPLSDPLTEDTVYLFEQLLIIKTACENYDDDTVYEVLKRLKEKTWSAKTNSMLEQIKDTLYVYSDFDAVVKQIKILLKLKEN
ncbi:MAG: transporter substrate-binding domain-containing protein [Treponema sp.]|nr:transporter substrate-binding domain-containing protein [Treponema sp.]